MKAFRLKLAVTLTLFLLFGGGPLRAELQFAELAVNVGVVRTGTELSHLFHFVNQGSEPVEIVEARPSCGCLTPRLAQRFLKPGEEGDVALEVNTLIQGPGLHTWTLRLVYRCGSTLHEATLQVGARIVTEVMIQPAALVLFAGHGDDHAIFLSDVRSTPLTVTRVVTDSPHLTPRLAERKREKDGRWVQKIRLDVAASCPEGRLDDILRIYTDDPAYAELKMPITVIKRGHQRLSSLPGRVELRAAAGQSFPARIILLRDGENRPVKIERVTVEDPSITWQWAAGPENLATLKISVDQSRYPGGTLQSAIHVRAAAPINETLTIPVICTTP
jgi:hypothetical protein